MKKLLNDPRHAVREMLEGFVDVQPSLALLDKENVIVRAGLLEPAKRGVAIISGGGSGHEPAHGGYVGTGMLTGAVAGDVFTSPSVDAIHATIRAVAGPAGVVMVVKNYTGDRLNFGLAGELAQAEGIPAEIVVVADDVALRDTVEPARRRGIAGTVLVHKVIGAAAAAGLRVEEVARIGREAAEAVGTMGVSLGPCTVPAAGRPGFSLAEDEIELGLGIHGEAGVTKSKLQPADKLVDIILETICSDRSIGSGARVALMVNGLGGTPPMELAVVTRHALDILRGRGVVVERAWTGNLLTALEMPGCSISLMTLDDARLKALDAPSSAPAWPGSGVINAKRNIIATPHTPKAPPAGAATGAGTKVRDGALAAADALDAAEKQLTELDSAAGDGDLGASMQRGAEAIRAIPADHWGDASSGLSLIGNTLRRAIAGSSGPFYAVALLRAARYLTEAGQSGPIIWAGAFRAAVHDIARLGGAKAGDRTMLDALLPAVDALEAAIKSGRSTADAWAACVAAAEKGAEATKTMLPRLGRASYLGERALGVPDAGAAAVVVWLKALTPIVK